MKTLSAALAAALIAGSCAVAFAQGGGGDSSTKPGARDPDKNPTATNANPTAGNTAASKSNPGGNIKTAPVAGTPKAPPMATKEMPANGAGAGGTK